MIMITMITIIIEINFNQDEREICRKNLLKKRKNKNNTEEIQNIR
jgi:hypothetical protein